MGSKLNRMFGYAGAGYIVPAIFAAMLAVPGLLVPTERARAPQVSGSAVFRHTITPVALEKLPASAFGDWEKVE